MITRKVLPRVAKPVVLIAEELSPATLEALGPDFEVRNCDGADRGQLLAALAAGVDAVLIRSATKMDAEAIAAAKGLKVIARAGVGLDNVDIPAATAAGVMVVNAPTSNRWLWPHRSISCFSDAGFRNGCSCLRSISTASTSCATWSSTS
jgi:D-3-phosphoglycerate dehydrogenase